jgi:primosomal protein N'
MAREFGVNAVLVSDLTGLKEKVHVLEDVLNVMDWAIEAALEELEAGGALSKEQSLLAEYREAIKVLRARGFSRSVHSESGVQCPSCKALLKDIAGEPGDRCSWCGHEFK